MKRVHPFAILWLVVMWILLWGELSIGNLVAGIGLARIFHWWGLLLVVGLGLWVVVWWGWLGPGRGVRPGAPFGGWWLF